MILHIFHTHSRVGFWIMNHFIKLVLWNTLRNATPRFIHHGRAMVVERFGLRAPLRVKIEDPKGLRLILGYNCWY